jgi:glycosyltransferase involved in cell wall biosynthesis
MIDSAVSVVMPTYNRAHLIGRAVESCLEQLDARDELIIVDDGSTDDTEKALTPYADKLRYIKTSNNGAGAARNRGMREARNPLLSFIDSDDEWLSGKIWIQRAFMQAMPDVLFSFTNFTFKTADGRATRFALVTWSKDHRSWDEIMGAGSPMSSVMTLPPGVDDFKFHTGDMYLLELFENYINVNTLMIRREEWDNELRFAEGIPTYEDWEFFSRVARKGKAAYLDIETACQYNHGGPRLTDSHVTDCARTRVEIIERVYGNDAVFLMGHEASYRKVLDRSRINWIKGLIVRGDLNTAREQIAKVMEIPFILRIFALFPDAFVMCALHQYRIFKRLLPFCS